jgi:hypothetical protein
MRVGPAENAGHRLMNDVVIPANDMTAATRWLRFIAIPIITASEVTASMSNGNEVYMTELIIASSPRRM